MAINSISCLAVQLLFISLCSVSVNTLKAALGSHRKPNLFTFRSSIADIHTWSPRIQKIKNLSLHKDILRDITASEFALRLESAHPKKDQIVDFDRLISKLDADLFLIERRRAVFADSENLISRILRVREDLLLASQNLPLRNTEFILTEPFETIPTTEVDAVPTEGNNKLKMKELRDSLRIRVREDGTVDWDGTLATGSYKSHSFKAFTESNFFNNLQLLY